MVESYFNTELVDVMFDSESRDEWEELCKELGLEGQLGLVENSKSPIPYPHMNEVMKRVYKTLCPTEYEVDKYHLTTIPLEVIRQIALAKKEHHFQKIHIWADNKSPDPVVVGVVGGWYTYDNNGKTVRDTDGQTLYFKSEKELKEYRAKHGIVKSTGSYFSSKEEYLIARWGDELRPFKELKEIAIARYLEDKAGEMERRLKTIQEKLKIIKENVNSYFNGNISEWEVTGGLF